MTSSCSGTSTTPPPPTGGDACPAETAWRNQLLDKRIGYGRFAEGPGTTNSGTTGLADAAIVTNTNDTGPGSFREAATAGNKWVTFDPDTFPKARTYDMQTGGNAAIDTPIRTPTTIFTRSPVVAGPNTSIDGRGAHARIANLSGGDTLVVGSNTIVYNVELYGHGGASWTPGNGTAGPGTTSYDQGTTLKVLGANAWCSRLKLWQAGTHCVFSAAFTLSHSQIWNVAGSGARITAGQFTSHHNWWPDCLFNTPGIEGATAHQFSDLVNEAGADAFTTYWASRVTAGGCLRSENNRYVPRPHCNHLDCYVSNTGGALVTSGNIFEAPIRNDSFSNVNQTATECGVSGACPPIPYPYQATAPLGPTARVNQQPPNGGPGFYNGSPQWEAGWHPPNPGWINEQGRNEAGVFCQP